MSDYPRAIAIIKKYEGFSEKAFPDPMTGEAPWTIGYGTQFYPGGAPVRQGHRCTQEKAIEYLEEEVNVINKELSKEDLNFDLNMREALISFIHSVGWPSFLYSAVIDHSEREEWLSVGEEIMRWVYDARHHIIGGLVDRRREEVKLFLTDTGAESYASGGVLLKAFREYTAASREVEAIRKLESQLNPYILAAFAYDFDLDKQRDYHLSSEELYRVFDR
jgi:lysozyme